MGSEEKEAQEFREFWIEKFNGTNPPTYKVFMGNPEDMDNVTKISIDGESIPACEYFLTVEYSALTEALQKLEEMEKEVARSKKKVSSLEKDLQDAYEDRARIYFDGAKERAAREKALKMLEEMAGALEFYKDTKNYTKEGIIFSWQWCGEGEKEQVQDFGITAEVALESYRKWNGRVS